MVCSQSAVFSPYRVRLYYFSAGMVDRVAETMAAMTYDEQLGYVTRLNSKLEHVTAIWTSLKDMARLFPADVPGSHVETVRQYAERILQTEQEIAAAVAFLSADVEAGP